MSDPILLFLTVDVVALLLLGTFAAAVPLAVSSFLATMLSGLGMLLCLPPLLMRNAATDLTLPLGPPGLSLAFALDALSACFLAMVFLAGTAITAFHATNPSQTTTDAVRTVALCLAGTVLSLLAADGVGLAIGLAVTCGAIWLPQGNRPALLIPLFVLAAVCLLTPAGFAPRFDAIRAAPVEPWHAWASAALTILAVASLALKRPAQRSLITDTTIAAFLVPVSTYLLLRLLADLPGSAIPAWCGFVLVLGGGAMAVVQAWRAASHPDIDGSALFLTQRQAAFATTGVGMAMIARAADLPSAASFALAATLLSVLTASIAGILASLAIHIIGASAGTYRLSRLGGLAHAMPETSAALAVGLLGLSAIPPSLGFASLWLLFQSILSAPRTGGLLIQLPLALIGAAVALSAALATAGSVRLIGIAILGRPRTPRGAGAWESASPSRVILIVLAGLSLLIGVLPGPALWVLADPVIRALTGAHTGLPWISPSSAAPGYLALPVLALLALATGSVMSAQRWSRKEGKIAGPWADGMAPPVGLPFGEPGAQSIGDGFLPSMHVVTISELPSLPVFPRLRPPSATAGLWIILVAFAALLLIVAVIP